MAKVVGVQNPATEKFPNHLWAIYGGKVLLRYNDGIQHPTWFKQIGLPYSGPDYDRIRRGRVYIDFRANVIRLASYTDDPPPESYVKEIIRKMPAKYRDSPVDVKWFQGVRNPRERIVDRMFREPIRFAGLVVPRWLAHEIMVRQGFTGAALDYSVYRPEGLPAGTPLDAATVAEWEDLTGEKVG